VEMKGMEMNEGPSPGDIDGVVYVALPRGGACGDPNSAKDEALKTVWVVGNKSAGKEL
jgi:hypothetical protein